jgi:hypothetical protein
MHGVLALLFGCMLSGCLSDAHRLSHLVQDGQDAILEQMLSYKVSL